MHHNQNNIAISTTDQTMVSSRSLKIEVVTFSGLIVKQMNQWTETRETLVQLAMDSLNISVVPTMSDAEKNCLYNERYFAYMVVTYLGKEIAIHGTPFQREHILRLMKSVNYEWDENNRVFYSTDEIFPIGRVLHLTGGIMWSDEIADIVDETFEIRAEINMTPLLNRMTYELIFDIAPAIIQYGDEAQLTRLNVFIDSYENHDRN